MSSETYQQSAENSKALLPLYSFIQSSFSRILGKPLRKQTSIINETNDDNTLFLKHDKVNCRRQKSIKNKTLIIGLENTSQGIAAILHAIQPAFYNQIAGATVHGYEDMIIIS